MCCLWGKSRCQVSESWLGLVCRVEPCSDVKSIPELVRLLLRTGVLIHILISTSVLGPCVSVSISPTAAVAEQLAGLEIFSSDFSTFCAATSLVLPMSDGSAS